MSAISRRQRVLTAALFALLVGSCTEATLQPTPPDIPPPLDNLLRIKTDFCTEVSADVIFPVKTLFLIDQSASLQCTDQQARRFTALNNAIDGLSQLPGAEFAFVGFASWSRELAFTSDRALMAPFLDPAGGLGPATDYQGALATAIRIIEQDILDNLGPLVARTKYLVVFVSDGTPEPRCNPGCEDTISACADGEDNDGDGRVDGSDVDCQDVNNNSTHPDNLYGVCNYVPTDDDPTLDEIRQMQGENLYADFEGICPEYNQPQQILQRIQQLLDLKEIYNVGDITLHTTLLFSPQAQVEAICPGASMAFGYDKDLASSIMRAMAAAGNGTFRDVNLAGGEDNFLNFDITSLKAEQILNGMMTINEHARLTPDGELRVDMDTDGLIDDRESEFSTERGGRDTDGDLYSDAFEVLLLSEGFDPIDPDAPALDCPNNRDGDGDGLNDCEEAVLETDPTLPDTDGDNITDWTEMILGTQPIVADGLDDVDFDGILNYDEIRGGTNPLVPDDATYRDARIVYGLEDRGLVDTEEGERHCYGIDVNRVQLVQTPLPSNPGLNRVLLYTFEGPARISGVPGEVKVACFEANWQGGRVKNPRSGVIDVSQESIEGIAAEFQNEIDDLVACDWFGVEPDHTGDPCEITLDCPAGAVCVDSDVAGGGVCTRAPGGNQIVSMVNACTDQKVQIGERLYKREDIASLVGRHIEGGRAIPATWDPTDANSRGGLPARSFELFVPIADFVPEQHCYRPWEFDLMREALRELRDVCRRCSAE